VAKKLFEVLIIVSSLFDCLRFYLLSALINQEKPDPTGLRMVKLPAQKPADKD